MMNMRSRLTAWLATGLLGTTLLATGPLAAAEETASHPLLMPGKQSLYQRVLAVPGARLSERAGWRSRHDVTPFTAYYVYGRRNVAGRDWLQIGTDRHGGIAGWLPADKTLEWNQGLTVAFRPPIDQDRTLLFRDSESLRQLAEDHDLKRYERLYHEAEAGELSADSPVVAIQPAGNVDIRENFYLVPIRDHQDVYLGSEQARLLRVASVPLAEQADTPAASAGQDGYRSGLVFVIDSTLSMDPYIERTREAVMKVYDRLGAADLLGHVNFGLTAFRDDPAAAAGLDYRARTFVTLEQGRDPKTFLSQVDSLSAARASSVDFIEDSYAGVYQALEDMDWRGHDARYLVLITDAGAREADDPLSGTGMNAEALRRLAQDKGVAIFVLHLLTPATMANHQSAAAQYRQLSDFPGLGSLYYGVPTGDLEAFGTALDALAGQITEQVRLAVANRPAPGAAPASPEADADPQLAALQAKVAKLGYALRLKYLQQGQGGSVPTLFDAWLLDRDFRDPARHAVDVRVLLTRDQLSDLHDVLQQVLQTAEEGLLSPENFLSELKSLAATIARDPERIGGATATAGAGQSLADLGFMREYIEDLPYQGEVMTLSLEDWESWPAAQQIAFLGRLEEKIGYYRALHDHTDLWVSLDGGSVDGDSVFPVALDMLP